MTFVGVAEIPQGHKRIGLHELKQNQMLSFVKLEYVTVTLLVIHSFPFLINKEISE